MRTAMDETRSHEYLIAAAYKREQQQCAGHVQVSYGTRTKVSVYVQMKYRRSLDISGKICY
jgi:hypothetical protein